MVDRTLQTKAFKNSEVDFETATQAIRRMLAWNIGLWRVLTGMTVHHVKR
ncbi:hypothetical protein EDC27_2308 [Desulfosoma caldarium]|uniref:Uncharacterized protein n=1 Tax=Desulfosoma caldarium TaxID=610254 RepID=A0A3N1UT62_9BACT|nr:hypothetical protein EDC27_2308 [Desulfosoma caldarium]